MRNAKGTAMCTGWGQIDSAVIGLGRVDGGRRLLLHLEHGARPSDNPPYVRNENKSEPYVLPVSMRAVGHEEEGSMGKRERPASIGDAWAPKSSGPPPAVPGARVPERTAYGREEKETGPTRYFRSQACPRTQGPRPGPGRGGVETTPCSGPAGSPRPRGGRRGTPSPSRPPRPHWE